MGCPSPENLGPSYLKDLCPVHLDFRCQAGTESVVLAMGNHGRLWSQGSKMARVLLYSTGSFPRWTTRVPKIRLSCEALTSNSL